MEFSTLDISRPKPLGTVEEMVRLVSTHLVEVVVGHKPGEGNANAQRRYNELSRLCVVANHYEQGTAIGAHSENNALYVGTPPFSNKWSSVATWWPIGYSGFDPHCMPSNPA